MSEEAAAVTDAPEQEAPTPNDVAPQQAPEPSDEPKAPRKPEDYEAEITKLRRESATYRTKLREAEPIVKQHQEREEANKTELQKTQEALAAREQEFSSLQIGYTRLELAASYNISPENIDLIGSGTREEMEDRAARLGALVTSEVRRPPTDRPVEGLRPGATPEPPRPADNSYPAEWGFTPPRNT